MSYKFESNARSEAGFLGLIRRQFTKPTLLPAGISLRNQFAIVTGSNVGLGFEVSRQLLRLDLSHLIMGVRSEARGKDAAAKLQVEFPSAVISVWALDMESYESVEKFSDRCKTLPRIDLAILNAGLVANGYSVASETGHEKTLQVNYLSTAFLTLLLIPILKKKRDPSNPRPPVISLSGSDTAYDAQIDLSGPYFPQLDNEEKFRSMPWYKNTKLFLIFFIQKVAELVSHSDVLLNVTNPGMTKGTALGSNFSPITQAFFSQVSALIGRELVVGASCYLDSVLVQGSESHGSFTSDWTIKPYPEIVYTAGGERMKEKLWKETIAELEKVASGDVLEGL